MKVLALSDLHLDHYLLNATQRSLKHYCESVLRIVEPRIDVITVAGDIGHYNADNKLLLQYLAETYSATVLFTYGNHDAWLCSPRQITKYNGQSMDRLYEMRDWAHSQPHIHYLDGSYIDIQGVRFGGIGNWYDGSYMGLTPSADNLWRTFSDHFRIFKNGVNYHSLFDLRDDLDIDNKLATLLASNCDYLFTHVCPIIDTDLIQPEYLHDYYTAFFFSNNTEQVFSSNLRYLQFGHTHSNISKTYVDFRVFNASLGYPKESKLFSPTYVDIQ